MNVEQEERLRLSMMLTDGRLTCPGFVQMNMLSGVGATITGIGAKWELNWATTNHTVIVHTRFGTSVTAPVIYVKDLGDNRVLVHLETNYHIKDNQDIRAP